MYSNSGESSRRHRHAMYIKRQVFALPVLPRTPLCHLREGSCPFSLEAQAHVPCRASAFPSGEPSQKEAALLHLFFGFLVQRRRRLHDVIKRAQEMHQ